MGIPSEVHPTTEDPHAYPDRLRVERARSLPPLGCPASEITSEVGFTEQSHPSRRLRRHLGAPPGAHQRDLGSR